MGDEPGKQRHTGTVKWFSSTKGFGFITPSNPEAVGVGGAEDLFVHQSNINAEGFRSLREGEAVEFDVEPGPDGRSKAINVSGPGGQAPQGAPPRNRATVSQGVPAGRGGRGGRGAVPAAGRGYPAPGRAYGYGYPAMHPMYFPAYYYPGAEFAGEHDPSGRGRGRGRGAPGRGMAPGMMYPAMPGMGMAEQSSGLQVVVHNLPWSCTWQQLKDTFKEWKVERADIMQDQYGRSRGWGTVRFTQPQDALAACDKWNNAQMDGRTISVRIDRFA